MKKGGEKNGDNNVDLDYYRVCNPSVCVRLYHEGGVYALMG